MKFRDVWGKIGNLTQVIVFRFPKNGGGGAQLSTPSAPSDLPHDIIRFYPKTKDRIFEVCAPLYEAGCSLREIEEKTGFAKSSVRAVLNSHGLTLRNATKKQSDKIKSPTKRRPPILPYGYGWLEGKLVVDPREYKIVLKIINLWQAGQSLTAIASYLNRSQTSTRLGEKWFHKTIGEIIKRHFETKT